MAEREICKELDSLDKEMTETLMALISIPAIGPENGGDGESRKAEVLTRILQEIGLDKIERFDSKDPRVSSGLRPNIVAYLNGETNCRLWIITHLDVVPPGEDSLWTVTRPFKPLVLNNRVYGRGSEDNGQSMVASIFAAKALKQLSITPKRTLALAFVSDEEQGSIFGIQHLLQQGLFNKDDIVLVPDGGNENGSFIEVTEKSILWLRIITTGKQTHASMPNKGLNAHRIGMQTALALDKMLHERYNATDSFFSVPKSTFEPTRKDKNVDAINIVPGEDVFYFDCRILPNYDVEEILQSVNVVTSAFEKETGATIKIEIIQKQVAPPFVDGTSEIVRVLKEAIRRAKNIDAEVGGVGGGTCAAFFRNKGLPAIVWSNVDEVAHQQDEYSRIANIVNDAKVFALLSIL
jgi:succinyl-diaminopimelate desuccinylase